MDRSIISVTRPTVASIQEKCFSPLAVELYISRFPGLSRAEIGGILNTWQQTLPEVSVVDFVPALIDGHMSQAQIAKSNGSTII